MINFLAQLQADIYSFCAEQSLRNFQQKLFSIWLVAVPLELDPFINAVGLKKDEFLIRKTLEEYLMGA